ncbi:MAG: aminoacylase [Lysobacterales bacterium]|nr:MAG: aminoacylase [Xanthomonadales bacterium]
MTADWNLLIRGALVFDGSGAPPRREDVAVAGGRVAARGPGLDPARAERVVEAGDRWLMPGLLDIHTHLDLEVELAPGLEESVRHGTTTVVVGNCSLGTAFGAQRRNGEDPILDCFTRVENIPKSVLRKVVDRMDWTTTAGYLEHLAALPLGPNVVPLLPHSMLRIEAMGTAAAVSREPTAEELRRMAALLEDAMRQGYAGFSTDAIPFHYLANEPHTDKRVPAQHATLGELKALLAIVRRHDRVWQCTPDASNRVATFLRFFLTSGRLFGSPLRTSALTAVDLTHERNTWRLFPLIAGILNSRLVDGRFHFQVLATPFRMYAEGSICPIFEEFASSRRVMACDVEDAAGRRKVMSTDDFGELFVREWHDAGAVSTFNRDLDALRVERCPVPEWQGESLGAIRRRLGEYQAGRRDAARSAAESEALASFPPVSRDGEFLLHLFRRYDRDLRWWFTVANDRPEILEHLLFHEHMLPGFNDSGAHLLNLAFFDGNLLTLQIAQRQSVERVAHAVRRLTREPAEFFGVDAGRMDPGCQADLVLIDPEALATYDTDANRRMIHREIFDYPQLVNRSDGVVTAVFIAGEQVWDGKDFSPVLGRRRLGRPLTAGHEKVSDTFSSGTRAA